MAKERKYLNFKNKAQRQYNKQRAKARNRLVSERRSGVKRNHGIVEFTSEKRAQKYADSQRKKGIHVHRTGKKVYFEQTVYKWQRDLQIQENPSILYKGSAHQYYMGQKKRRNPRRKRD